VLTTHILEIAERLAERISIVSRGRIVAQGSMAELRAGAGRGHTLEDIFLELTRESPGDAVA
jgi:ABC-2 type transport system ATP-binding protein